MKYTVTAIKKEEYKVSKYIHSVFFEYLGKVIYDGIWVGKDSQIENIDGIRKDVIDGLKELGVGAMRWPGGCCADQYHWKNGIGSERKTRIHAFRDPGNPVLRNDFGTDEFLHFCELTGAEPVITVNTATGSPEEFVDWYEYVNGDTDTKFGAMRAENGHPEPYNVKFWGLGNTDDNVWGIDYNNPVAYAQTYLKFQRALLNYRDEIYFIGLGLSTRHGLPGWTGKALDHITRNQRDVPPDAISVHHYLGGMKQGGELCGTSTDFTDAGYYALLDLLWRYQYDIDLQRITISEHARQRSTIGEKDHFKPKTKICFDEWGAWHADATQQTNQNQKQTMRDAMFAALSLHIFYKNSDIVEFAMETQLSNLLQSLFETDGERFYKTPTFYVMKMFKEHMGQYLTDVLPHSIDKDIDTVATVSDDEKKMTISIVNRHLYNDSTVEFETGNEWKVVASDIITCDDPRAFNTFDEPYKICEKSFEVKDINKISVPKCSIIRICLER